MKLLLSNDAVTIIPEAKKITIALLLRINCSCYRKKNNYLQETQQHNIHDTLLYLNLNMNIN